jgi:hypothetical protein
MKMNRGPVSYVSTQQAIEELMCRIQTTFIRSAPLSEIRSNPDNISPEVYFLTNNGLEGLFEWDRSDRTSLDDGINTIVTVTKRRYKRVSTGGSGGFISGGVAVFSGDGRVEFHIPHNQGFLPLKFAVTPMTKDSEEYSRVAADATNLTIKYKVSPPLGEDNLAFSWMISG